MLAHYFSQHKNMLSGSCYKLLQPTQGQKHFGGVFNGWTVCSGFRIFAGAYVASELW